MFATVTNKLPVPSWTLSLLPLDDGDSWARRERYVYMYTLLKTSCECPNMRHIMRWFLQAALSVSLLKASCLHQDFFHYSYWAVGCYKERIRVFPINFSNLCDTGFIKWVLE